METCTCMVHEVLTLESVAEILCCDRSDKTSLAVCVVPFVFSIFYKMKFAIFLSNSDLWPA